MSLQDSMADRLAKTLILVLSLAPSYAAAQGLTYVEAVRGGITGGTPNLSPTSAIVDIEAFINDDLWGLREFGSGGVVIVAGDDALAPEPAEQVQFENAPEITQTITGLTPGTEYDVYAVYWSAVNSDWGVRAGLTSNPGANQYFNRTGVAVDGVAATAGVVAGSAIWDVVPAANGDDGLFVEGNRQMLLGLVGSQTANNSGLIDVFIDDLSTEEITDGDTNNRAWFDGLAFVPAGIGITVESAINRNTGELTLNYTSSTSLDVTGYSIQSVAGSLDAVGWNSIATGSNSSLDPGDTWTESSALATELAESETSGSDGFALNGAVSFGDAWDLTPYEDVTITLTFSDATELTITPEYTGTGVTFGSLDGDDDIDVDDFVILTDNLFTDVSTLTDTESYFLGDLTRDQSIDYQDFIAFRDLFDNANGAGAFSRLNIAAVPEPSSLLLLAAGLAGVSRRRRSQRPDSERPQPSDEQHDRQTSPMITRVAAVCLVAASTVLFASSRAGAIEIAAYDFESGLVDISGNGRDALVSEGAFLGSGQTFANGMNGLVTDPIRGNVFDLTGGGEATDNGGDGTNGGLNLTLPVGGLNTGSWSLALWVRETDSDGNAYLFDNRNTAAGAPTGDDRLILSLGQGNPNPDPTPGPQSWSGGTGWIDGGTPVVNDGLWNHVAWTYDGVADSLEVYVNGTSGGAASAIYPDLLLQDIELGNEGGPGGAGGQTGRLIDDVRVFDTALTASEVTDLLGQIVLELVVDTTDGTVSIVNNTDGALTFDYYEIASGDSVSPGSSLDTDGWFSLDDAERNSPAGQGWVEAGGSDSAMVGEANLTDGFTLDVSESVAIGTLFDTSVGVQDLSFAYGLAGGSSLVTAEVSYVAGDGIPLLPGDYNGDNIVDIADYTVWRDGNSPDSSLAGYDVWLRNFGRSLPPSAVAVPEPGTLGLLLVAGLIACKRR